MGRWLAAWLQFLMVMPSAVSCYLPMRNQLRGSPAATVRLCAAVLLPYSLLAAWLMVLLHLDSPEAVLIPSLVPLFFLYQRTLRCDVSKSLAVFVGVFAMQTFPAQFARSLDSLLNPQIVVATLSVPAASFQLGLSVLLAAAFAWPELRWFRRMVDELNLPRVWYATTGISALFLAGNLLAVPRFYSTLRVARLPYLFPALEGFALVVLSVIYLLFSYGTSIILENTRLREENRLLELQGRQYRLVQKYVQRTSRLRHDFRHTVRLLATLAESGDLSGLRAHLAQYVSRLADDLPRSYCANPALNALFAYYHAEAAAADIETDWQIELPDSLPLSEVDLAALFGNLMENAIHGCRTVAAADRYFSLISEVRHGMQLYIVSTNSFDGATVEQESGFASTKQCGSGIGLASIDAIARKYNGFMRAQADGPEFCVDVQLRI